MSLIILFRGAAAGGGPVTANLTANLAGVSLNSSATLPISAGLSSFLAGVSLNSSATLPISAGLSSFLAGVSLNSSAIIEGGVSDRVVDAPYLLNIGRFLNR